MKEQEELKTRWPEDLEAKLCFQTRQLRNGTQSTEVRFTFSWRKSLQEAERGGFREACGLAGPCWLPSECGRDCRDPGYWLLYPTWRAMKTLREV